MLFALHRPCPLAGQPGSPQAEVPELDYVTIKHIYIRGNRRTRPEIILRELDFAEGDTISLATLGHRIEQNQFKVLNTGLFTSARINFKEWEGATNFVGLEITVKEGLFIIPIPILELADRNFNVWWDTYNHALRRLNLGVRFYHTNFTGRKDVLKAVVQFGFTKKYELTYTLPYFNKHRNLGLNINFLHTREKEIGYTTSGNRLLYSRNSDSPLLQRFRAGAGLLFRRKLDVYHQLNLAFHQNIIHETVLPELNPDFFLTGLKQRYMALSYEFVLDKRDIKPYPLDGYYFAATAAKEGFGLRSDLNTLDLSATWFHYFPLAKRWSLELGAKGKTGLLRQKQPYYNSVALGYLLDNIRGYEYYVIDGLDYAWQKSSLRFELTNKTVSWGKRVPFEAFKEMPLKLYLSLHNEWGYVNNPFYKEGNSMSNRLLWGTSLGFDVVMYYNRVFSLEFSRNHVNEFGFFLHWAFAF
jgi:outer membrane protein assembly factor BamA